MNPLKLLVVAQAISKLSKDPSTKVGATIIDDDCNVLSMGFNGFPRGVNDSPDRYTDRPTKYKYVVHAELNAIAQAARNGIRLMGSTLLVTALYPCSNCAKAIIQSGIKKVLTPKMPNNDRWNEESEISKTMFEEAGVVVELYEPGAL